MRWFTSLLILSLLPPMSNAFANKSLVGGTVESRRDVILSTSSMGTLVSLPTSINLFVKKGTPLYSFKCVVEKANVTLGKASLVIAQTEHAKNESLASMSALSKQELSVSKAAVVVAESELKVKRAEGERCTVRAPFSGKVSELFVKNHATVKAADPILRLTDTSRLFAKSYVDAHQYNAFQEQQAVDVHVIALSDSRKGIVTKKSSIIEVRNQRYMIEIEFNDVTDLAPGMVVTLE